MLTWALPGNAKGIYYLVEQGNTSFDFTFRHRVPAVGHFEMNNRPQNTKPPLSEGERRFYFAEKMTLAVEGHWLDGRIAALPRRFNVRGPNEAGKPAWHHRRQ